MTAQLGSSHDAVAPEDRKQHPGLVARLLVALDKATQPLPADRYEAVLTPNRSVPYSIAAN